MQFVPGLLDAISASASRYGVDPNALQRIAWLESSGGRNVQNPNSSAGGPFQFIDSTARQYGLTDRYDINQSADAAARLTRDNAGHLRRVLGREPTPGELYLAHQQGAGGASKLLSNPNARAVDVVGADAVRLNGGNENMTAGEFANLWVNKANTLAGGDYTPPSPDQMTPVNGGSNMQQGLLAMIQQQHQDQPFGERLKGTVRDGSLFDALAQGFNTMRGPMADQGLARSLEARSERRQETNQRNQTADWLESIGNVEMADAVRSGLITGAKALEALQPQQADPFTLSPGQTRYDGAGNEIASLPAEQDLTSQMRNFEYLVANGMDPQTALDRVFSGGVTVNNNMGQDKFEEAFAKGDADALGVISEAGMTAQRNMSRIDQLSALLEQSPSGFAAMAAQRAGEWGINTEGLDTIQAAQALINSLVPEQRQPGSGPMSDADLELFKQSLPRLINQPGGNRLILDTMRAIAQYDAEGAEIVQRLRAGEINRATAFQALQDRQNPLAQFTAPAGSDAQQGGGVAAITDDAGYDALPSGAMFRGPDGVTRRKP